MAENPPKKRIKWDKERAAELWKQGFSASKIAAEIGGITKNAGLGFVWKAGLARNKKPAEAKPQKPKRPRAAKKTKKVEPNIVTQTFKVYGLNDVVASVEKNREVKGFSITELNERQCRFPISSTGTRNDVHLFCGNKCFNGQMYCAAHRPGLYKKTYVRMPLATSAKAPDIG